MPYLEMSHFQTGTRVTVAFGLTVSQMSLIQLLRFKTWEMRLLKMPHLVTPHFQKGMRVTVAYAQNLFS